MSIAEETTTIPEHPGRNAMFAALAKAQGGFQDIKKNREVTVRPRDKPSYTFRYADLDAAIKATRKPLSEHGLFVIQPLNDVNERTSEAVIETILGHEEGGTITSRLRVINDYPDPKQFGAVVTYLRRYAYTSMLNIAADDDLDEDGSPSDEADASLSRHSAHSTAKPSRETSKPADGALPACAPDVFTQKSEGWKRLVTAGKPVADMIAMIETKHVLTDEQKAEIASWAPAKRSEKQ